MKYLLVIVSIVACVTPAVVCAENSPEVLIKEIRKLISEGYAMEELRRSDEPSRMLECVQLRSSKLKIVEQLTTDLGQIPITSTEYKETVLSPLGNALASLSFCVSCTREARKSCTVARNSVIDAERALTDPLAKRAEPEDSGQDSGAAGAK